MQRRATGEQQPAREACRMGLINEGVPPARRRQEAVAMADKINENSPIAARVTKEMVTKSLDLPLEYTGSKGIRAWDLDDEVGAELRQSEDWKSREGPRAFVEKRKPVWQGR